MYCGTSRNLSPADHHRPDHRQRRRPTGGQLRMTFSNRLAWCWGGVEFLAFGLDKRNNVNVNWLDHVGSDLHQ
jgi:hypothetical protein